jgi:hypothetical protein
MKSRKVIQKMLATRAANAAAKAAKETVIEKVMEQRQLAESQRSHPANVELLARIIIAVWRAL